MIDDEAADSDVVRQRDTSPDLRLKVGAIALVVECGLAAHDCCGVAIPARGLRPLPEHVRHHPLVAGAAQRSEVVHLEAGAAPVLLRFPQPVAALLRQARIQPVAAQRRPRGIVANVEQTVARLRPERTLEVVRAAELRPAHGGRVAPDLRDGELRPERVGAIAPVVQHVHTTQLRVTAQPRDFGGIAHEAVRGRPDDADARVSAAEVLAQTSHKVVGQRLGLAFQHGRAWCGARDVTRVRAIGQRVEERDGESAGRAAGDLSGAENGGGIGHVGVRGL